MKNGISYQATKRNTTLAAFIDERDSAVKNDEQQG